MLHRISIQAILVLLAFSCAAVAAEPAGDAETERLFAVEVLPLLKAKCLACHGDDADDLKGEFDMRTRAGLLRGGESEEPAVVPGDPLASPLYQAIRWDGLEMPPKENDRLTEEPDREGPHVDCRRGALAGGGADPRASGRGMGDGGRRDGGDVGRSVGELDEPAV